MTKEREPAPPPIPTTPPTSPPQTRDAQDRAKELQRLLEDAKRRGREEPGATTILVPSRKG